MNQLIFQISVRTELDEATWLKVLKEFLPAAEIISISDKAKESKFDWDAEVKTTNNNDEYYKVADELYSKLLFDSKRFSNWEYKFISDMYSRIEEKGYLSDKQKEWLDKLREKYL